MNTTDRLGPGHSLLLALGFLAGGVVYSGALGPYLTWAGQRPSHRLLIFFLLPATATAIALIVRSLRRSRLEPLRDRTADEAIDGIVFIVSLFLITVHLLLMAALLQVSGVGTWGGRTVVILVGLTLAGAGNLLPRTRPNAALGIRTRLTLADRQLWILTHRVTGYIAVLVGLFTIASGLFLSGTPVAALPGIALFTGGIVVAACYWKWTRVRIDTRHA